MNQTVVIYGLDCSQPLYLHTPKEKVSKARGVGGGVGSFVCERSEQEEQREYNSSKCF